jgi:hypothetical protein
LASRTTAMKLISNRSGGFKCKAVSCGWWQ